ncbi:MAG: hypothetical protein ACK4NF_02790 [Planctomycetota bacterium]
MLNLPPELKESLGKPIARRKNIKLSIINCSRRRKKNVTVTGVDKYI